MTLRCSASWCSADVAKERRPKAARAVDAKRARNIFSTRDEREREWRLVSGGGGGSISSNATPERTTRNDEKKRRKFLSLL